MFAEHEMPFKSMMSSKQAIILCFLIAFQRLCWGKSLAQFPFQGHVSSIMTRCSRAGPAEHLRSGWFAVKSPPWECGPPAERSDSRGSAVRVPLRLSQWAAGQGGRGGGRGGETLGLIRNCIKSRNGPGATLRSRTLLLCKRYPS